MNKNELRDIVNNFTQENSSVKLQLGHKENKDYLFLDCCIDDSVQVEILALLKKTILEVISNNELVNFDPIGKQDGTIEILDVDNVENYNTLIIDRADQTNFVENVTALSEINFYFLELENSHQNIKIFRRYSKSKSLSKGSIFKLFSSNLSKIEENIFQVDSIVDFIVVNDNKIIIFNRYSFEVITNYKDNYMENLETALNEIDNSHLINNIEKFKEDCKNSVRIAKQFTKAMQQNSINLILNHSEDIAFAIREAELPIEFKNNQFQYESKEQLSILVALLSDRYAKTLITKKIVN